MEQLKSLTWLESKTNATGNYCLHLRS